MGDAEGKERFHLKTGVISLLLVSALLLGGPAFLMEGGEAQEKDIAEWTFMVYMDADNNLEDAGIDDMNEMEKVGSTDDVNIVVEMDRIDGYDTTNGDWTGARRFRMEADNDPSIINSPVLQELGEVNMGDPEELVSFAKWAVTNYPAKRYAMVLWDHGGAFRGICYDDTVPGLPEGEYDMINMTELNLAAERIYQIAGNRKIDLWGFDACLMAQVAVQYELKDFVKVAVASGYNEPGDGWPYDPILGPLVEDPGMDEREFGKIIVDEYIISYEDGAEDPEDYPMVTQAAFDMTRFDDLIVVLDQLSEELASRGPAGGLQYLTQIYLARKNANSYDMANVFVYDLTGYPLYDVIDFTLELERLIASAFPRNTLILDLCRQVRDLIRDDGNLDESFMFYSRADRWHPDANGLSMYFPNRESDQLSLTQVPTNYLLSYEETGYARQHLWDEFLHAYYGIDPIEDSKPTIMFTGPDFNRTVLQSEGILTITGIAYDREMIDRVEIRVDGGDWTTLPGITGQGRVVWIDPVDVSLLEPGVHVFEARARDRPSNSDPGTPGQITSIVRTQIYVEEIDLDIEEEWEIPSWVVNGFILMVIISLVALGVIIFRGKNR